MDTSQSIMYQRVGRYFLGIEGGLAALITFIISFVFLILIKPTSCKTCIDGKQEFSIMRAVYISAFNSMLAVFIGAGLIKNKII